MLCRQHNEAGLVVLAATSARVAQADALVCACRFAYDGALGDSDGCVSVWAPTAQSVSLLVFDSARTEDFTEVAMARQERGCWQVAKDAAWDKKCYLYRCRHYTCLPAPAQSSFAAFLLSHTGQRSA